MTQTPIVSPGIYDITNDEYHEGSGISKTGIKEFMKSPMHYWERYVRPDRKPAPKSPQMTFGSAFHIMVLESHLFKNEVAIMPNVDRRTKVGKEEFDKFNAEHGKKIIISADEFEILKVMAEKILSNPTARKLIEGGQYERSIYYNDDETNLLCKTRPDILHGHFIADVKTAADASFTAFQRDMFNYGYHLQAAMCFDGVNKILQTEMQEFVFIVIEKLPPYAVAIYALDLDSIEFGRNKYRSELVKLKQCMNENEWPSYESRVISLPTWALNQ